ncbi:MAG: hypothetical protein FJ255_04045 [Phycisphaerae bacterium]|nr:hypothetical protein [Phycisphaerae bacterium]
MPGWYDLIPTPQAVLWFMAAFLLAWGLSVLPRAVTRTRGLRCPACAQPMKPEHGTRCPACLNDASTESNLHHRRRRPFCFTVGALAIVAGTTAAMGAVYVGRFVRHGSSALSDSGAWHATATGLIAFAIVFAAWACRGDRSRGRRRCPRCWYSMAATAGQCPECGFSSSSDRDWYRPRRRRRSLAASALLAALALGLLATPRVIRYGWAGAVPTTVLIAGLPWLPERLIDSRFSFAPNPGALSHRVATGELWAWQSLWLRRRSLAVASDPPTDEVFFRAIPFADPGELGSVATALVLRQASLLASSDPAVRATALDHRILVWRMGVEGPVPGLSSFRVGLLAALDDERSDVRALAAEIIGHLESLASHEAERLANALEDQPWVQRSAFAALARHLGRAPEVVLAALTDYADPSGIDQTPDSAHNRGVLLAIALLFNAAAPPFDSDEARAALVSLSRAPDARTSRAAREVLDRLETGPTPPPTAPPPPR